MLDGQAALVTGGAKRLGKAIALALAKAGANVAVQYRDSQSDADETVREIESLGVQSLAVSAELTSKQEIDAMFDLVEAEFGRCDILINNASHLEFQKWDELSPDDWQAGLNPLTGAFLCCQRAVVTMRPQGGGRIVNITDSASERFDPAPESMPYRIAKNGTTILTKTLAQTETPYGITVNSVSPGTIADSITKPDLDEIPAARYAAYDDITNAVLYLLRPESSYISGANIRVTGGWDL